MVAILEWYLILGVKARAFKGGVETVISFRVLAILKGITREVPQNYCKPTFGCFTRGVLLSEFYGNTSLSKKVYSLKFLKYQTYLTDKLMLVTLYQRLRTQKESSNELTKSTFLNCSS